jgi:uncharacterized Ntn-hydrolase superfamily protein
MTFSIVAIDKKNKEVGFAIASCCWNAGLVCAAEPEIGAIASQAQGNLKFLSEFFLQLEQKKSLEEILAHFKETDEGIENRQIGMITFEGEVLAFSGKNNSDWAGHKTGKNYSCQGNILVGPEVVDNMSAAFEKTKGTLKEKLLAALVAGNNAGGDARGKQSARLLVKKIGAGVRGSNIEVDITIEDHDDPVKELERILNVRNSLMRLYQNYGAFQKAESKEQKIAILEEALEFLADKKETRYMDIWTSLGTEFMKLGETEKAIDIFRTTIEINPNMRKVLANSFPEETPKEVLEQIMKN